jgi:hypothetical protein
MLADGTLRKRPLVFDCAASGAYVPATRENTGMPRSAFAVKVPAARRPMHLRERTHNMTASTASELIGYLAYVEIACHGIVGGYLLVNRHARPVHFHCNAPLRASRTQEILYGPTLRSYLYCDQIARSLLDQSQHMASVILTDEPQVMGVRPDVRVPIVALPGAGGIEEEGSTNCEFFHFQGLQLGVHKEFVDDARDATATLRELTSGWDFTEPFQRIREAIGEAQRAAA